MPLFSILSGGLNIQSLLTTVLVLSFSLSFHEYAHARAAFALGDDTAALQGRLTLNPMAHLDPIGSLCFLIGGIGWARPVPINPNRFARAKSREQGMVLVSLAGPGANLIISVVAAFLWTLLRVLVQTGTLPQAGFMSLIFGLLQQFYISNIFLAVFNLLPVPPLDGFKAFGALLPRSMYYGLLQRERQIGMVFLLLIVFGRGTLGRILQLIATPFNFVIWRPMQAMGNLLLKLFGA